MTEFVGIGGDKRLIFMKRALCAAGWREGEIKSCDVLILPIPSFTSEGVVSTREGSGLTADSLLSGDKLPRLIIGGRLPASFVQKCAEKGVKAVDITDRDDFAILNAVPTAEAAIMIALEELPVSLWNQEVFVTGYGRVAQVLCDRLAALGVSVTVGARKAADRAYAETRDCKAVHISDINGIRPEQYRLVYNTVPHTVIDRAFLARMRPDALIIDLASAPGGCDTAALAEFGIRCIHALSLPGRNAPETAGEILAQMIVKIAREEEMN